jgi:hypothetical protein
LKGEDIVGWMDLGKIGWDGVDWVDLSPDRDQWRALVKMVVELQIA